MRTFIVFLTFYVNSVYSSGSSTTTTPVWIVNGTDHKPCIMLKGDITLNVSYVTEDDHIKWVSLPVSAHSHVGHGSSCDGSASIDDSGSKINVESQILQLELDEPKDWIVTFYFSRDSRVHGGEDEFVMYLVTIFADYNTSEHFEDAKSHTHNYSQPLSANGDAFGVQDSVYANTQNSYFCPSEQKYLVVDSSDPTNPEAWINFKNFRVQAYSSSLTFLSKETCPADEVANDKVPVIVGGCLAGLVLLTLVVYLVYRSRLPPSVLYLTNPNSHFEDLGFDNKGHSLEDEDEPEHGHGHNHVHEHNHHGHIHYQTHEHKHTHFEEENYSQSYSNAPSYE